MTSARHPQRFGKFSSISNVAPLALVLAVSGMLMAPAYGQLPRTRLTGVTPVAGQVGKTVELTIIGTDIDEVSAMSFSHPGITAVQKTTESGGKKTPVANTFVVTIAGNVAPGLYDVRVTGLFGASNPSTFAVTSREVIKESEGNNTIDQADEIALGQTVFGQVNGAADVDYLKFSGKQGQRIVIDCQATRVDSSLHAICEVYSRAGGRTRLLSFVRRQVGHDPLTDVVLPADGDYFVKIFDERFLGSTAHTYLLTAHAGPHIDFVRPAAGVPGKTGTFTLFGRNLPGGQAAGVTVNGRELEKLVVKIPVPANSGSLTLTGNRVEPVAAGLDAFEYTFKGDNGSSNPVPIYFATGTTVLEAEPNNTAAQAQKITIPADVTGTLQQRGDEDVYEFKMEAGQVVWLEVISQRLGAPADPYLIVDMVQVDKDGKEQDPKRVTAIDDNGTNLFANHFDTLTDDPTYRLQSAGAASYRVTVRDRNFQGVGSSRHNYRLAIRPEKKDFRAVVMPMGQNTGQNSNTAQNYGIALRKGEHFLCRAMVFRRDGFNAPVQIIAEGLPKGVVCHGTTIGAGQTSAPLVFTATEDAPELTTAVKLVAKAKIDDATKVAAADAAKKAAIAAQAAVPKTVAAIKPADDAAKKATAVRTAAEKKYTADNKASTDAAKVKADADKKAADTKKAAAAAAAADTAAKKKVTDTAKAATDAAKALTVAQEAAKKAADDAAKKKAADAVKAATEAKAKADKAAADAKTAAATAAKAATDAKNAAAAAAKAKVAADKKAADTAKVTAASKTAFDKADAAFKAAQAKLTAAKKAVADARKNVTTTAAAADAARKARDAAAKQVAHPARVGTIVINGAQNNTAVSRLARSLVVSVMKEKAPFQVQTDSVVRVDANRLRQILVPVKLAKRNGFNNQVTLTWVGQPKNVQVANKPIKKGANSELLRIFLPNNAPIGTYALYLRAQGQVSYSRNPFRVERAKAAQKTANEAVKAAAAELKTANDAKAKADKLTADTKKASDAAAKTAADAAKALAAAQQAAKKAADDAAKKKAADAVKAATEAKAKADKAAADAKKAADDAAAAKVKTDAAQKTAVDKDKAAKAAKAAADKEVGAATGAAKAKNVNAFPPSGPIIISIRENPATLKADVPGGGNLKRGAKLDVKVTVTRANGFSGPVTVTLPLPPGISDLKAAPVTIPADKTEGVLSITAGPKATEGGLANMVVRAAMQFEGREALVDQPITIKVAK